MIISPAAQPTHRAGWNQKICTHKIVHDSHIKLIVSFRPFELHPNDSKKTKTRNDNKISTCGVLTQVSLKNFSDH